MKNLSQAPTQNAMKKKNLLLSALVGFAMVAAAGSALAANGTWNNTGTTDFNLGTNWTPGLPGTADRGIFDGAVVNQPALSANITMSGITFNATTTSGYLLSSTSGSLTLTSTSIGNTLAAIRANNTSGTNTISAPIILGQAAASGAGFLQTSAGTLAITGNISSTNNISGLTLSGPSGKFILSGNNTYSGNTTIGAASIVLNINSATAISSGALVAGNTGTIDNSSGSAIILTNNNNINLSAGNLTFTGSNDLSFGSGVVTMSGGNRKITITNAKTLTVGSIDADDNTRTFEKVGTGTLAITGAAGANFQGGTTLVTGGLLLGNKAALGTGLITIAPSNPASISASTDLSGGNAIENNVLFSSAGTSTFTLGGSNNLTLNGSFTIGANKTVTVSNTAATELSGPIYLSDVAGTGYRLSLTNTIAAAVLTVSGDLANYSGGAGTAGSILWTGGTGTTLRLSGANSTYTGVTGYGGTAASSTIEVTKLADGGVNSSIGASSNAASNLVIGQAGVLRYVGGGDSTNRLFTLDGTSGTGSYTIASSGSGAIEFTGSGAIAHTGLANAARTLNLRGTNTDDNILAPVWTNNGSGVNALIKLDVGTWVLTGNNTYTGTTTLGATNGADAGTLKLSGSGKISNNATTVFSGSLDVAATTQTITTLTLGAGASGTAANVLIGSGGVLNLGGSVTYTPTNNPNGATISGAGTLNLNASRTFAVSDSTAASADLTINSIIADGTGTNSINKTQAGTLVLGGNNSYTGGTTLTGGTLGVSHNNALGTGTLTIAGTTALQAVASDVTLANAVSGTTVLLTVSGTQNLTLNGGLTSTGDITLTNSIGSGKLLTIGSLNIGAGASVPRTMIVNGAGDLAVTGAIANGAGATAAQNFSSRTTGTTTLSGNNTLTGITSVTTGTLVISSGSINTSSAVTVSGGKLKYDSSTGLTRTVTVTGGATFAYNSTTDYTGTLTLTAGKLGGTNWNGAKLGGLTIGANQTITPGNSVGNATTTTQTWANSGSYVWEISKGNGTAGDGVGGGWDLLTLSGALTISATSGTPFAINITSLGLNNLPGPATGFNDGSSYNWLIADAGSAITTFSADKFTLDTTGFQNTFTGTFAVALGNTGSIGGDNTQLYLTYTAVPEPATWALLAFSLTTVMVLRRRRNS